jgi:hypothetical protein
MAHVRCHHFAANAAFIRAYAGDRTGFDTLVKAKFSRRESHGNALSVPTREWGSLPGSLGFAGGGRFLQAQILPMRCALHRFDHGFHELPNTVPLALKPGEWHQLTVRETRKRLEVWQDGTFLLDYEGDELPQASGQVGLRLHGIEIKEIQVYNIAP